MAEDFKNTSKGLYKPHSDIELSGINSPLVIPVVFVFVFSCLFLLHDMLHTHRQNTVIHNLEISEKAFELLYCMAQSATQLETGKLGNLETRNAAGFIMQFARRKCT